MLNEVSVVIKLFAYLNNYNVLTRECLTLVLIVVQSSQPFARLIGRLPITLVIIRV